MDTKTGRVTRQEWKRLVRDGRDAVQTITGCQFHIGDLALRIEPIQPKGAQGEDVGATLRRYADEIGVVFDTLIDYRYVASAWPKRRRVRTVPWTVHRELAALDNRFELIKSPPWNERLGRYCWTTDDAARAADRTPHHPVTEQEKVNRIHDLAKDDTVAVTATHDLLRRPEVVHRVISDPTTRHMLNRAQVERSRETEQVARERTPAIRHTEQSILVTDLLGANAAYVAAVNRLMPAMHDHRINAKERKTLQASLDRVRAAADWCQTFIDTGDASLDEQLAKLLRGE